MIPKQAKLVSKYAPVIQKHFRYLRITIAICDQAALEAVHHLKPVKN